MASDNKPTQSPQPQIQISANLDTTPILYTDSIFISTNEDGVILDITQKAPVSNQLRIVSRIGMSRIHAKKFLKEMSKLIALTEGKSNTGNKE